MKAIELGSAMVTKSPDFTPLAAMPRAMRLLRRCSSRQVMVLSSQVTAGASGLAAATRTSAAPIDMGFSGVPGSAMDSCLDETKSPSLREGRRESNRCAGGRLAYTGIGLNGTGAFAVGALDFAPAASALALSGGFVFLAFSLWSESSEQWQRLPQLLAALFAPSLAEALVFVGIVFSLTQYLLTPALGHIAAVSAAVLVTSASFGVYHLTHAAPWNSWHTIRILF